jgi:oligosaccharide repeat unit polymerase
MLAVRQSGRARWLSLLTFAPSVLVTVILTTKSSILLPLALFAAAYIAAAIATGNPPRLSLKRAAALAGLAVVLIGGFVLVQMARYAGWASGSPGAVLNQLWLSLFPYFGVFSGWLLDHGFSASLHPTLGSYTFAGVFDLLRLHGRVAGLYTEQVVISGTQYNIYTAFRGLVEDFTIPGALVFLALAGFGAQLAYRRVRAGDIRFVGLLAAFYAAILWSFVVDIFIYNTIVLAFVLLAAYLAFARLAVGTSVLAGQFRAKVAPGR